MKGVGHFSHQKSGCYWYRIQQPMEAMRRAGVPVTSIRLNEDVVLDDIRSVQVYGIFPFSFETALTYIKSQGIRIVYDLDDALDMIDPSNPFYHSVRRDAFSEREIFKFADHVTASTQAIANYARTKTELPITVVPNCYNPEEWTYPRPPREGIRIGFAGSTTHVEDLLPVLPHIRALQEKYSITFLLFGFGPETYDKWIRDYRFAGTDQSREDLDKFVALMEGIKFEWVPFVDFENFPSTLINMSLDIGLCPLKDSGFNRARSASKAMEYTLGGALALCTDIEAYNQDPTSVLVKDGHWYDELEFYITHPEERKAAQEGHLQWIKEKRNIDTQVDLLKSIYLK